MEKSSKSITKKELRKELGEFTEEVLLPSMQKVFATKDDLKEIKSDTSILKTDVKELKADTKGLKREFEKFKNKTATNQDAMLKKLDILLTEKTVGEHQEKKEKRLWAIIIKALEEHQILSSKELEKIAQLEIF